MGDSTFYVVPIPIFMMFCVVPWSIGGSFILCSSGTVKLRRAAYKLYEVIFGLMQFDYAVRFQS